MAAIVTRTDRCGGWRTDIRHGTTTTIGGKPRRIHADDEGSDKRSLGLLERKGFTVTSNARIVKPTKQGRDALAKALASFVLKRDAQGPAPRRLPGAGPMTPTG